MTLINTTAHRARRNRALFSLETLRHHLNVWKQRRDLKSLDDHLLNDLGLTREQVDAEASRPIWDAPQTWRF